MVLPKPFTTASPALASFSFSEFASGLGFVKFFFAGSTDSTGISYILTERALFSKPINITIPFDLNFDLSPFNRAIRIKGNASINLTTGWATAGGTNNFTYTINIKKWNSATSTETPLISITGGTTSVPGSSSGTDYQLIIPTIPETNFAQGEQLRINIVAVKASGEYSLKIDPADRSGTDADSLINIPFLIDL